MNINHKYCDKIIRIDISKEKDKCEEFLSLIEQQQEDFGEHYRIISKLSCDNTKSVIYVAYNSYSKDICGVFVTILELEQRYLYIHSVVTKSKRTSSQSQSSIYSGIGSMLMQAVKNDYDNNPNIFGIVLGSVPTAREFYKKQGFILLENGDNLEKYPDNDFDIYRKKSWSLLDNPDNIEEEASRVMVYLTKSFKNNPTYELEQLFLNTCMRRGSKQYLDYLLNERKIKIDSKYLMSIYSEDDGYIYEHSFAVYYFYKELNIDQKIFDKLVREKNRITFDLMYAYLARGFKISNNDLISIIVNKYKIKNIMPILDLIKEQITEDEDFNVILFQVIKGKDYKIAIKYLEEYISKDLYKYIKRELIDDTNTNQKLIQHINKLIN